MIPYRNNNNNNIILALIIITKEVYTRTFATGCTMYIAADVRTRM